MGQLVRVLAATGMVAATSFSMAAGMAVGMPGEAHAAAAGDYYADVQGQYATVEGSVGSAFLGNLLSGQVTLGELQATVDSTGVKKLNGFTVPAGVKAGARGDLVNVGASLVKIQTDHVQSTAPVTTGPAQRTYLPIALAPVIDAGLIHGESSATWSDAVFARAAKGRKLAEVNGDTGYLRLLDLSGALGGFGALLPQQLQHPVLEVETTRAHGETATVRNDDGTHGLSAGGIGGLAAVQIFGGASNGGITLGVFNHDTGGEKDTAGSRVYATGKPGGAGCSYVVPDTIQAAVGSPSNKIALSLSTGQRITIPGGLGYLDVRFVGQSHCETSADGTYAHATGAGVGISLHLTLPGVTGFTGGDIGSLTLTLPDLDSATVRVPKGGIPPTDGPVTPPGDGGDDGTVDPPSGPHGNGGPSDVPTVVASGEEGRHGVPSWALPLGGGLVAAGAGSLALLRRRLLQPLDG